MIFWRIILIWIISLDVVFYCTSSCASDYPKTKIEKEMEEIGSFVGSEGIMFRSNKARSDSTKHVVGSVNKYLFQAAIDLLGRVSGIIVSDTNSGIVITNWYDSDQTKSVQLQLRAHIKDQAISPEAIDIEIFRRLKIGKKWSEPEKVGNSLSLESNVVRDARSLYLKHKK